MSIMDHQLLRQKVDQKITVIKTNTSVFIVFKTKCELNEPEPEPDVFVLITENF